MNSRFRVHPSFYVFWFVFCLLDDENILPVFLGAAVIHELGHAAAICACGGCISGVQLSAAGAVIRQEKCLSYGSDCVIALAGPAAGIAAAWIFGICGYPTAAGANLILSFLNCLPVLPLDGGCALRSLLAGCMPCTIDRTDRVLLYSSLLFSLMIALSGGFLLWYTQRNATVLVIGLTLLSANGSLLHGMHEYGMITVRSCRISMHNSWKQG